MDRVLNKPPKLRDLRAALAELVTGSDLTKTGAELPPASGSAPRFQIPADREVRRYFSMQKTIIQNSRILIVDDQLANIRLLERILKEAGYKHWTSLTDSREVLAVFSDFKPDLVALDWRMPNVDGLSLLKQLRSRIPERRVRSHLDPDRGQQPHRHGRKLFPPERKTS